MIGYATYSKECVWQRQFNVWTVKYNIFADEMTPSGQRHGVLLEVKSFGHVDGEQVILCSVRECSKASLQFNSFTT